MKNLEKYDNLNSFIFFEGLAAVVKNGKWGYVDQKGNEVIPFEYDFAGYFCHGLALVQKNGKFEAIDQYGEKAKARPATLSEKTSI